MARNPLDHHQRILAWDTITQHREGHRPPIHRMANDPRDISKEALQATQLDIHSRHHTTSRPTIRTCSTEWRAGVRWAAMELRWAVDMVVGCTVAGIALE